MQNSYRQINKYPSLIIIGCSLPFILWVVSDILPTFDDFTTLQSPQFSSPFSKELLPNDSFWRPWDYLFGCVLGWNTSLFPILNHIIIILGHTANTLLIYTICRKLDFSNIACHIATLLFFFSPASLGATLACDGLNQTYAQFWGLMALWGFLNHTGKGRIFLWFLCTMIAALSKENGLAWAVVPPIVSYAFKLIDKKRFLQYLMIGLSFAAFYFLLRFSFKVSGNINHEYIATSLTDHLKDLIQLLAYNWLPIDYMSIVYEPERNGLLAAVTLIASLPFLLLLVMRNRTFWKDKTLLLLVVCFFILASPHLLTLVSIMHNYATLSLTALIAAYLIHRMSHVKWVVPFFSLFLLAAIFTDIHHTIGAIQSGNLGKKLALEAISQTNKPIQRACCISITDDSVPKYSSFAVRPTEAFAWGLSVRHYNQYAWPAEISFVSLNKENADDVKHIADSLLQSGIECVWMVNDRQEKVVSLLNNNLSCSY